MRKLFKIKVIIAFVFLISFIFWFSSGVLEYGRPTRKNLSLVSKFKIGDKLKFKDIENGTLISLSDEQFSVIKFPIPAIMAHPTGHIVFKNADSSIVQIRLSENFKVSQEYNKRIFFE